MSSVGFLFDHNVDDEIVNRLQRLENGVETFFLRDLGMERASDPDILAYAASMRLIVVTYDKSTMVGFAKDRLLADQPMTGLVVICGQSSLAAIAQSLLIA